VGSTYSHSHDTSEDCVKPYQAWEKKRNEKKPKELLRSEEADETLYLDGKFLHYKLSSFEPVPEY